MPGLFGNEGAHVENIDAVKVTENWRCRVLDISGEVAAFEPPPKRDGAASENVGGQVESVGEESSQRGDAGVL